MPLIGKRQVTDILWCMINGRGENAWGRIPPGMS